MNQDSQLISDAEKALSKEIRWDYL